MPTLLDHRGQPISSSTIEQYKKASPPKLGEAFGNWAGRDLTYLQLPGGGTIGFDLNKLTLSDYRKMTTHYQINSSLSVLGFLLHQSDWKIECDDKKIADACTENLSEIWTALCRSMNTAHWAGFGPNVLQWENDLTGRTVNLTKIKDLIPEECWVNWKEVEGYKPPGAHVAPKLKVYDGIKQFGAPYPIPVEATLWYPMLMTHGDYYGTKLLKPAFTSWYFSLLLHLFANRYYERFGEPTPVGRAPLDDDIEIDDGTGTGNTKTMSSINYMLQMLQNIRNRSVVVLPNQRNAEDADVKSTARSYDYEIEYLESQMRGADFERYMSRLDEEMSLGLFTPILLMRTADVGSYNLGVGHMQIYLWMLNALNGDRKTYIDKYVLSRMVDYKFSPNAPRAKIKFRKMGNDNSTLIATVVQALLSSGKATVDLDQLGEIAGLTLKQARQMRPTPPPADNPPLTDNPPPTSTDTPANVADNVKNRVALQVGAAFGRGEFDSDLKIDMGYRKKMRSALRDRGVDPLRVDTFFRTMDGFLEDVVHVPFADAGEFTEIFSNMLDYQLEELVGA